MLAWLTNESSRTAKYFQRCAILNRRSIAAFAMVLVDSLGGGMFAGRPNSTEYGAFLLLCRSWQIQASSRLIASSAGRRCRKNVSSTIRLHQADLETGISVMCTNSLRLTKRDTSGLSLFVAF